MIKTDTIKDCIRAQHELIERQDRLIKSLMSMVKTLLSEQRDLARAAVAISISNDDPEPHGSRDTFVPHPNEETEHYNAMQD